MGSMTTACTQGVSIGLTIFVPLYYELVHGLSASDLRPGADPDRDDDDAGLVHVGPRHALHRALQDACRSSCSASARWRSACWSFDPLMPLWVVSACHRSSARHRQLLSDGHRLDPERGGASADRRRHGGDELLPRARRAPSWSPLWARSCWPDSAPRRSAARSPMSGDDGARRFGGPACPHLQYHLCGGGRISGDRHCRALPMEERPLARRSAPPARGRAGRRRRSRVLWQTARRGAVQAALLPVSEELPARRWWFRLRPRNSISISPPTSDKRSRMPTRPRPSHCRPVVEVAVLGSKPRPSSSMTRRSVRRRGSV